jgi:hypothetical protein
LLSSHQYQQKVTSGTKAMADIIQAIPLVGHVHLVLFELQHFYLEIPVDIIDKLCLKPLKYLRYLGWCVLGAEGTLKDGNQNEVNLDDDLVDQAVYHYKLPPDQQGFFFTLHYEI